MMGANLIGSLLYRIRSTGSPVDFKRSLKGKKANPVKKGMEINYSKLIENISLSYLAEGHVSVVCEGLEQNGF